MEFQAYASTPARKPSTHAIWQKAMMLHRNDSLVLPGALLTAAGCFIMYEHFTQDAWNMSTRNFLFLILITMLPLGFLEKKVFACADPVGTICKFSGKVLLMHPCFLAVRLPTYYGSGYNMHSVSSFLGLVAACVLLPLYFGVRSLHTVFYEHRDVWCIALLSIVAAVITEGVDNYRTGMLGLAWSYGGYQRKRLMGSMIETSALYTELMAFVPAIWYVCRPGGQKRDENQADVDDTRRRAVCFFSFLLSFYVFEDVWSAFEIVRELPLAALGHTAHYLLLLDFAGFVLAHLFDQEKLEKLMGSLTHWLTDACSV